MWWVILWIWCETCGLQHEKTAWIEEPTEIPQPGDDEWHGGEQNSVGWRPSESVPLWNYDKEEEE